MNNDQHLAALDRQEKAAKPRVELGKALERLKSNRDFKALILEGYLQHEAVRLVHTKADPSMQEPAQQAAIVRDIDAIGALAHYFDTTAALARMAAKEMTDVEAQRNELLAGEGE